jgi:DNA-binding NarL/FixJ family response regulator
MDTAAGRQSRQSQTGSLDPSTEDEGVASVLPTPDTLHSLASALVARWQELDDAGRLAQVREILQAAAGLRRHLPREDPSEDDEPEPVALMNGLPFLTRRELEVLRAIAEADTTSMMAARFAITPLTVRSHVKNVLHKLGVHSRLEAARMLLTLQQPGAFDDDGPIDYTRLGGPG